LEISFGGVFLAAHNNLTGISDTFHDSAYLSVMDISFNAINMSFEQILNILPPSLQFIELSHNQISVAGVQFKLDFSSLSLLQSFYIQNNSLSQEMVVANLPQQLIYLDLSSNNISGNIDQSFGQIDTLKYLYFIILQFFCFFFVFFFFDQTDCWY
jgi:hypothetical protein